MDHSSVCLRGRPRAPGEARHASQLAPDFAAMPNVDATIAL